jgi:cytochrome P450
MAVQSHRAIEERVGGALSLTQLLDPEILANPYPLYRELRETDPVHWDPYLHAWVVTRYEDVITVLRDFSAARLPAPDALSGMGLDCLLPITKVMVQQMLFLDPPAHRRIRSLASEAFSPRRVARLREHIRDVVRGLLDAALPKGRVDVIGEIAEPMPYIITAEMLGVPVTDAAQLKAWSKDFAQLLGNFQYAEESLPRISRSLEEMTKYFGAAIERIRKHPREGLLDSFLTASVEGDRFTDEEIVANAIVTMVGGQETTTNLIGNGTLTLLRHPADFARIQSDLSLVPSAVEEMLRYEPPSQHTARLAVKDCQLGQKTIRHRQAVIAVLAAANRDPDRFLEPDHFEIDRKDNRHLSFGWAAHFCIGATLARVEAQVAFEEMIRRISNWSLDRPLLTWRENLGLRGLTALPIRFDSVGNAEPAFARDQQPSPISNRAHGPEVWRLSSPKRKLLDRYIKGQWIPESPDEGSIPPRPPKSVIPLSLAQEQIWLRSLRARENPSLLNESITIHFGGPVDLAILERSLAAIVQRHEAWRTSFGTRNGAPVQRVRLVPECIRIPVLDLRDASGECREERVSQAVTKQVQKPFHLERGPLWKATLLQLEDESSRLVVVAHHSIVDGVSAYQILPSELAAFYYAFRSGRPPALPALPIQFGDFSLWQRAWLNGSRKAKQIEYWRSRLAPPLPQLVWPKRNDGEVRETVAGRILCFEVPKPVFEGIELRARAEAVTLFTTLLAGFVTLLFHLTRQPDILVGTFSPAGRKYSRCQPLLGYFLNPVVLRFDLSANPRFRELLAETRRIVSEAMSHDDIPLESLWSLLGLAPACSSFLRVAISLQPKAPVGSRGWQVTTMDSRWSGSRWDFYLAFIQEEHGLGGRVLYNPELFSERDIRATFEELMGVLKEATANPELRMGETFERL